MEVAMTVELAAAKRKVRGVVRKAEATTGQMRDTAALFRRWPDFPVAYWNFERIRGDIAGAYRITGDERLHDLADEATALETELRSLVERIQPFMVAAGNAYETQADETIKDFRALVAASGLMA